MEIVSEAHGATRRSLNSLRLVEQAYRLIKKRIVRGQLPPGASFSEAAMSRDLELGKTPIREALARLQGEGLVTAVPRSGYCVTEITIRDVTEIFAVRALLEAEAARLAAARPDADGASIAKLRRLADVPFRYGDEPDELLDANVELHGEIARMSGNRLLVTMIDDLVQRSDRLLWLGVPTSPRVSELMDQHQALAAAISRGDVEAAGKVAAEHVRLSKETITEALLASPVAIPHSSQGRVSS
ncbi:GntR family transcriptional regulator [Streptomyces sp. 3N207]|uniref:GntR family transcriptional regulator n=1 Tax=Streptomyces sp. 3N207 TaxID=3457417 RepID=UPI003FCF438A